MSIAEIGARELPEVISVWTEVVVDDVQNDAEPDAMRLVHQAPQVIRLTVDGAGRKQSDAVITPVEAAGKSVHRHQLDKSDSELFQIGQLSGDRRKSAFRRECADVKLVNDLPAELDSGPVGVAPAEARRIHNLRRAVGSLGLESRARVGKPIRPIESVLVSLAVVNWVRAVKVSAIVALERK